MKNSELIGEQISSLVDGEVDGAGIDLVVAKLSSDDELIKHWERLHVISDALKNNLPHHVKHDLAYQVMRALESEPTFFASRFNLHRFPSYIKQVAGFAVAASVMMVAVIVTQNFNEVDSAAKIAKVPDMPNSDQFARVVDAKGNQIPANVPIQLDQYLVNHNQHATGMYGVLPYARIIGYSQQKQDN